MSNETAARLWAARVAEWFHFFMLLTSEFSNGHLFLVWRVLAYPCWFLRIRSREDKIGTKKEQNKTNAIILRPTCLFFFPECVSVSLKSSEITFLCGNYDVSLPVLWSELYSQWGGIQTIETGSTVSLSLFSACPEAKAQQICTYYSIKFNVLKIIRLKSSL